MSSNIVSSMGGLPLVDVERTKSTATENELGRGTKQNNSKVEETSNITSNLLAQDITSNTVSRSLETTSVNDKVEKNMEEVLDAAIDVVSSFMNQPPRNVNFTKDNDSGKTVIKVFDLETKELIKQFPSEELISIAKKIKTLHQEVAERSGIFLDKRI
jgi:flagellar protein FlaG